MAANLFKAPTSNFWSSSLNGAINDSVDTITLNSTTGLQAPGYLIIDREDGQGVATSSAREIVKFTGISGNDLTGVTRGADNSTARSHGDGALVESVPTIGMWNDTRDAINAEHDTDGTHTLISSATITTANIGSLYASTATISTLNATSGNVFNKSLYDNAIINGNFDVWQRGTTLTVGETTSGFIADRFRIQQAADSGTLPTLVHSQQLLTSGDITGSFYHYRIATNGAGTSLGVNSYGVISQTIENGTRFLCGLNKKITLSFYARSSIVNKKLGVGFLQYYGSGGSPTAQEILAGSTISLTSTWTKYTVTVTTNTLVGKTFGTANNDYIEFQLWAMWGSTLGAARGLTGAETYVGSGNIDIAQIKLEAGDTATTYQPRSYVQELADCQRYFEMSGSTYPTIGGDVYYNSGSATANQKLHYSFRVEKRAAPTITTFNDAASSTNNNAADYTIEGVNNYTDGVISPIKTSGFAIKFTTGNAADKRFSWTASAEL